MRDKNHRMSITIQAEESKKEREHSMMTERKLHLFCRILWGMTAAVILMLGYASGVKSRQMTMSGGVHIRIETEQRETEELLQVSPGETIKKQVHIRVEKCSGKTKVRVKLFADGITAAQQRDLLECARGEETWEYSKEDGYFYYRYPMAEGEEAEFCVWIQIPEKWGELTEKLHFRLELAAESV